MIWQKKPVSSKRELRRRKGRLLRPKLRLPVLRKKD